jgi:ribonuclease D
MPQPDFTIRLVKDSEELRRLSGILEALSCFALDIETINWWNPLRERVALLQIAFRQAGRIRVAVIDALADLDLQLLRPPFEQASALKIIHNAAFDAVRLNGHYGFNVSPVFDTMIAARRSGERKYSLKAQAGLCFKCFPTICADLACGWCWKPI